ncbi:MAG: HEPN domain-containing protein [Nitrospirae bacterium]|nr:HEPN domain-containing protein [Nitrospirota bacterium]
MTNLSLAQSYLKKASDRLDVLDLLLRKGAYSDVVREAQELVELALKGMLRAVGIEPPKFHDVGGLLLEHRDKYAADVVPTLERLAAVSKKLRKERELAFYGDIDFIPTEEYGPDDAREAMEGAHFVLGIARQVIDMP